VLNRILSPTLEKRVSDGKMSTPLKVRDSNFYFCFGSPAAHATDFGADIPERVLNGKRGQKRRKGVRKKKKKGSVK